MQAGKSVKIALSSNVYLSPLFQYLCLFSIAYSFKSGSHTNANLMFPVSLLDYVTVCLLWLYIEISIDGSLMDWSMANMVPAGLVLYISGCSWLFRNTCMLMQVHVCDQDGFSVFAGCFSLFSERLHMEVMRK